jgi:hypothetical protein
MQHIERHAAYAAAVIATAFAFVDEKLVVGSVISN